jgi:ParB family chromosome partitioning protein
VNKERRLGRGLEALLGRGPEESGTTEPTPSGNRGGIQRLNIYEIEPNPFQPRQDFDPADIDELAESIRQHGLLQPIVVRQLDGRYQLIAGDRRLRASIKAGCAEVQAQVIEADDRRMAELAMIENLQRKDLNPIEKAASFHAYLGRYECTQEDLAARLSIDRSTVANLIRLLELPEEVQTAVRSGQISQGHARALLPLGDEKEQIEFCHRIQRESLSVRVTEQEVQAIIHQADREPLSVVGGENSKANSPSRTRSEHLASLEQQLRGALGTKVDVRLGSKGRGRIVVHFSNNAEFNRLRQQLSGGSLPHSEAG